MTLHTHIVKIMACDVMLTRVVISLSRLEYHSQATWESGVASMMQNSKLFLFILSVQNFFNYKRKFECVCSSAH